MKVLVPTQGKGGLKDTVSPVFGRAPTFTFVEVENSTIKDAMVQKNEWASGYSGVGIQVAQFVANQGVDAIITGNVGPNASGVLNQAGIEVATGFGGQTVKDAVTTYLKGPKRRAPPLGPSTQRPVMPSRQPFSPPSQPSQPQQPFPPRRPISRPFQTMRPSQPSKLDLEFEKRMLDLQKKMIEEQINYIEKKIRELTEK